MDKKWVILLVFVIFSGCIEGEGVGKAVDADAISIGVQVGPASTLIYVAEDMGFFDEQGVEVELVEFTAGKFALQAFLAGSVELAASGEVPVTFSSLQGNEFYVLTQVVERTINEVRVIVLREEGLDNPSDYFNFKKRRLATSFGGGPEFYTYNFLKKYGIEDVELISQKPEDMPAALQSRSVDGIAIFDPFAYFAEKKLGDDAITFKDDSIYSELYVLNARRDWVRDNPQTTEKVLRALVRASEYIQENPEQSKMILMDHTELDRETVDGIWDNFVYKPALTSRLQQYLNAEAKWAIETGKVPKDTVIPDYKDFINAEYLGRAGGECDKSYLGI